MKFNISKESIQCQTLVIFLVCMYGLGAYFVYDSPAAIQSYLLAATGMTSAEYMLNLYSFYSMPSVVTCIIGGILIDQVFGMRLSGIIFCVILTVGQAMFAFAIRKNVQGDTFWRYAAAIGRGVTGSGVESIAVCCNVYLSQWVQPSLKPLAFGIAISAWRVSSTINLITLTPLYEAINTVDPRDGTASFFSTCVENDCNGGVMPDLNYTVFNDHHKLPESDPNRHAGNYYCYDQHIQEACSFGEGDHSEFMLGGNNFCSDFEDRMSEFTKSTNLKGSGCLTRHRGRFSFNMEICQCIDPYFYPSKDLVVGWSSRLSEKQKDEMDVDSLLEHFEDPFYWLPVFGEYKKGDEFTDKYNALREFKDLVCEMNFGLKSVSTEKFDSMADSRKRWGNINNDIPAKKLYGLSQNDTLSDEKVAAYVQRQYRAAIIDPIKLSAKTVMAVVQKLNSPNIYARSCQGGAYLQQIPDDDTQERLKAASNVYFSQILICVFSCGMAGCLYFLDMKVEQRERETDPEFVEKKKEKLVMKDQIKIFLDAWKRIPLSVWVLYVMCICFYVGVFTWVAQAPMFFEKYTGVSPSLARQSSAIIYLLAVILNPIVGALISAVGHEQLFLTSAYVLNGLGHLMMLTVKNTIAAICGPAILALSYAVIGATIWVLPSVLVDKDIQGQTFGLMFSLQNLGLTIGSIVAGKLRSEYGWRILEMFFIALQIVGGVLSLYIMKTVGISNPRPEPEVERDAVEEEFQPKNSKRRIPVKRDLVKPSEVTELMSDETKTTSI